MAASKKNRLLIINSSIIERDYLKKAFEDAPDIEIVAIAPTGKLGLDYALDKKPDMVILDMAVNDILPVQFCIRFLEKVHNSGIILTTSNNPDPDTIEQTIITLESGAFDFIKMPDTKDEEQSVEILRRILLSKVRGFSIKRYSQMAKLATGKKTTVKIENRIDRVAKAAVRGSEKETTKLITKKITSQKLRLIALGVSTGGPEALSRILPKLPADFPVPILLVIHMPVNFTATLAKDMNKKSKVRVVEGKSGQPLDNGTVYISEGGKHLVLTMDDRDRYILGYSDGPPENGCKPSIDILFRSVANFFGPDAAAVLLTGMGEDGVKGMGLLKDKGAFTLVQDEDSSIIWGMPGAAVKAGVVDEVLDLDLIHERLIHLVH